MQIDYIQKKVRKSKRPRIQMLTTCFGWGEGEVFVINMETDGELYFDDVNDRWTYVDKSDEGKEFIYVNRYKA